jgi:hypothetical protein
MLSLLNAEAKYTDVHSRPPQVSGGPSRYLKPQIVLITVHTVFSCFIYDKV